MWKEQITKVCVHHKSCREQKFNQGGFRHIKPSFLRGGQENISAPLLGPCPAAFLPSHSVPGTPWTSTGTGFLTASSGCWHACGDPSSWPISLAGFLFSYTLALLAAFWCPKDVLLWVLSHLSLILFLLCSLFVFQLTKTPCLAVHPFPICLALQHRGMSCSWPFSKLSLKTSF